MISSIIKTTAFALLLGLGACKVSRDTATPQPDLPGQFRNAAQGDTTNIASLPWKSFFGDPALQQLIDSAIVRNYDMQIALKNIQSAQLVLGQSKLGYWPDLSLNATYSRSRPADNSINGKFIPQISGHKYVEDFNANVSLSWEADIWGKIANQKSTALPQYLQTQKPPNTIHTTHLSHISDD